MQIWATCGPNIQYHLLSNVHYVVNQGHIISSVFLTPYPTQVMAVAVRDDPVRFIKETKRSTSVMFQFTRPHSHRCICFTASSSPHYCKWSTLSQIIYLKLQITHSLTVHAQLQQALMVQKYMQSITVSRNGFYRQTFVLTFLQ